MDRFEYENEQLGICPECGLPVQRSQKRSSDVKNNAPLHWDCFIKRCKKTGSLGSHPPTNFELETEELHRRKKKQEIDNLRITRA